MSTESGRVSTRHKTTQRRLRGIRRRRRRADGSAIRTDNAGGELAVVLHQREQNGQALTQPRDVTSVKTTTEGQRKNTRETKHARERRLRTRCRMSVDQKYTRDTEDLYSRVETHPKNEMKAKGEVMKKTKKNQYDTSK